MRLVFSLLVFIMICSCSTPKHVDKNFSDSIIYVHDVKTEFVHDTIRVPFPEIIEKNVTLDSVSHLQNKYAASDAIVIDGVLHHDLRTIPQRIAVEIDKEIVKDSTVAIKNNVKTITNTVYKEKPLTWWQRIRLDGFYILLLLLLLFLPYRKS